MRSTFALVAGAFAATVLFTGTANAAKDTVVELRVLGAGQVLEPGKSFVTNTEKIKTDRRARCFAGGAGGTGDVVRLPGPTAMGLIETAGDSNPMLDPLSVTDEFGFGLGLCGIGPEEADQDLYWNLVVNHQAAQIGGDQLAVRNGDEVLWHLSEFPPQPELELRASPGTSPGSLEVSVVAWECSTDFPPPDPVCSENPAAGAVVSGGETPAITDTEGVASVPLTEGKRILVATKLDHVQSGPELVCVSAVAGACPDPSDAPSRTIIGRDRSDEFSGNSGWETIRAFGQDDVIDIRRGGSDRVNCGAGTDRVLVLAGDADDRIASNCEKVVKR